MEANIYKIEALTNMHVGSGDANYGIIDNLIQRDAVNTLPIINGSSVKGALREFFEHQWKNAEEKMEKLKSIFGSNDNNADYRFLSSNLLAIPIRSNNKAYFLATAPMVINQLKSDIANFRVSLNLPDLSSICPKKGKPIVFTSTDNLLIEDFSDFETAENKPVSDTLFGDFENIVYLNDKDFIELCSDTSLPVIARNKVGENLWYEQVVPHKSLFTFIVLYNNNIADFEKEFESNIVHIGANATVGYGFTKISKL